MPPKNCAACTKLVYPMDELKCLDKTWHKSCFKCQSCSMTLNMKNYKGYNKLPYCNAHYPTTKFTAVADTPEIKRIAKNTKIQSNVKYHAEFEAAKGQYTAVADDPETLRVRKNMETISNVAYHGDMMRKQEMENARPAEIEEGMSRPAVHTEQWKPDPTPVVKRQPGSISDYDPIGESNAASRPSPRTQSTTIYSSTASSSNGPNTRQPTPAAEPPITGQPAPQFSPPIAAERAAPAPPPPEPEPEPEVFTSGEPAPPPPAAVPVASPPAPEPVVPQSKGNVSKAMYDYTAGDDDEVSFVEEDIIIDCEPIDDGWMHGTVERTGERGMLPSNYVERINW